MGRKLISLVMSFTMLFTSTAVCIPVSANNSTVKSKSSAVNQQNVEENDVKVSGTNSFGNLLASAINDSKNTTDNSLSGVSNLEITGKSAKVTLSTDQVCTVIVGIYDNSGENFITSGSAVGEPDSELVNVTINGDMPQYFIAKVFLLDANRKPLCKPYSTDNYSKEMQKIKAKTTDDFQQNKVINLDSDKKNNFIVMSDSTKKVVETSSTNNASSVDDDKMKYTFTNCDSSLTGLKKGDTFCYSYASDNSNILAIKVASINVDGKTVSITGEKPDVNKVFSFIKFEPDMSKATIETDTSELGPGVTYNGESGNNSLNSTPSESNALTQNCNMSLNSQNTSQFEMYNVKSDNKLSSSKSFNFSFTLNKDSVDAAKGIKPKEDDNHKFSIDGEISASLTLTFSNEIKYYKDDGYTNVDFSNDTKLEADFSASGTIEYKQPLCKGFKFHLNAALTLEITPEFVITSEGTLKASATFEKEVGFNYNTKSGGTKTDKSHDPEIEFSIEGTIDIGFALEISCEIDKILEFSVTPEAVFEIDAKLSSKDDATHKCCKCIDGTIYLKFGASIELSALSGLVKWSVSFGVSANNDGDEGIKLGKFYYSFDYNKFGFGECPFRQYKTKIRIVDSLLNPLKNIKVHDGLYTYESDKDGYIYTLLNSGKHVFTIDNKSYEAGYHTIYSNSDNSDGKKVQYIHADTSWTVSEYRTINVIVEDENNDAICDAAVYLGSSYGKTNENGVCQSKFKINENGTVTLKIVADGFKTYEKQVDVGKTVSDLHIVLEKDTDSDKPDEDDTDYECNPSLYTIDKLSNSTAEIKGYKGTATKIKIPSKIDGLKITSIGDNTFYYCTSLTSIIIPNSVTSIGDSTFYCCASLTSITIPNSVTSIGVAAFHNCTNLTNITIPNNVTRISDYTFYNCTSLKNITIQNGIKSIGYGVFEYCSCLISITIPNSVTSIGNHAFDSCTSLSSVTIPNSVKNIGEYTFNYCASLKSITIPNSVTSIGDDAFNNCSSLTSITIPNSVTSIGNDAFLCCTSLISITIPGSVKIVGICAFEDCSSLKSVNISNGVTKIENAAFMGCTNLANITISDSVTSIGIDAFYDTEWDNNQAYGVVYAGKVAYRYKYNMSENTSITLKSGTVGIADSAFSYCSSLVSITIPSSVTSIGDSAFLSCTSILSINVDSNNKNYSSWNGILCDKNKNNIICCPAGTKLTSVTIPNITTNIGNNAFCDCKSLANITIPDSVTSIGEDAFNNTAWYNNQADGVVYAGKVACKYKGCMPANASITFNSGTVGIAGGTFDDYSTTLTSITIPNSVTNIGDKAFYNCTNLSDVYFTGSKEQWYAIKIGDSNDYLTNATIHYSNNSTLNSARLTANSTNYSVASTASTTQAQPTQKNNKFSYVGKAGTEYLLISVKDANCNLGILDGSNIAFINQKTADKNGKVEFNLSDKYFANNYTVMLIGDLGNNKVCNVIVNKWTTVTKAGSQVQKCMICGDVVFSKTINPTGHKYTKTVVKPTYTSKGYTIYKCTVCGYSYKSDYTAMLKRTKISACKITLSKSAYGYTGKSIKPKITIKYGKTKLKNGVDYTVTYKSNKKIGKASIVIKCKGKYTGTKTVKFKINPKKQTAKLKAYDNAFKVTWKKDSQATGYQVQYAKAKSFKGSKKYTVKAKTLSKKIKGKNKTTYYVKVRTYKTVKGTKYYGAWSTAKAVKTK